jgi:hypothetical protein
MAPGGSTLLGSRGSLIAVGLVAVLVYANTLLGDFTFDDNFAVVWHHCNALTCSFYHLR